MAIARNVKGIVKVSYSTDGAEWTEIKFVNSWGEIRAEDQLFLMALYYALAYNN